MNQQSILENRFVKGELQNFYEDQFLINQENENEAIKEKHELIQQQQENIEGISMIQNSKEVCSLFKTRSTFKETTNKS